jgi:hypothetical protein
VTAKLSPACYPNFTHPLTLPNRFYLEWFKTIMQTFDYQLDYNIRLYLLFTLMLMNGNALLTIILTSALPDASCFDASWDQEGTVPFVLIFRFTKEG